MRPSIAPFILASLATAAACSSSSSSSSPPAQDAGATSPAVARFTLAGDAPPSFMDVPFPSDVYLANGRVVEVPAMDAVVPVGSQYLVHELAKSDGFSRVALASFFVDDATSPPNDDGTVASAIIDPSTLPKDEVACVSDASSVFLIDLEATDPSKARVACRAEFHYEPSGIRAIPLVAIGPARGVVLDEGHSYAAVLTSRVKDTKGNAITESADFAKIAAGTRSGANATTYGNAYDKVKTALGAALGSDAIVGIAPYTTNNATKDLFAMREALEASTAPLLAWDAPTMAPMGAVKFAKPIASTLPVGFTASLDDWLGVVDPKAPRAADGSDDPDNRLAVRAHDKIASVGHAVFDAVNYLQSKDGGYPTLDHATFAYDAAGKPIPAPDHPTAKIWITFAVPTAPMPANGYPAVIIQHGLGGSREFIMDLANTFAAKGWMAVAIDSVTFGARAPEAQYQVDASSDTASAPGAKYKGPDGFADPDANGNTNGNNDLFGNLENIGAIRDQMRQAAFDTTQVVKLLRSSTLDLSPLQTAATATKIDPARIAYAGDSLGAIQGAMAAAIEPYVQLYALNVAGGGLLVELASHSPSINALLRLASFANFGFREAIPNESHLMVGLIQQIVDGGDPLMYAPLLIKSPRNVMGAPPTAPRDILQFEVIYDELVPNEADEALARAGGWGLATPNVGSNSEILDIKNIEDNPHRMPRTALPDVNPDGAGLIHDTPSAGITAVVVQESPAAHGANMTSSKSDRQFAIPYGRFDQPEPFVHLDVGSYFDVRCPYVATQSAIVRFFDDGFQGNVPNVATPAAPIRDLDDDGATDDVDMDPSNPNVQ